MIFLQPWLAAGLAVLAAPVIIHLIHRRRILPQSWGAMMFLDDLAVQQIRAQRLHDGLLLLIRLLLLLSLQLALMRPVFRVASMAQRKAEVGVSAVLLVDDSLSMRAVGGKDLWREVQTIGLRYMDTLRKGDSVSVLFTSSAQKGDPTGSPLDLEGAKEVLRRAEPLYKGSDVPRALEAAIQLLEKQHNPSRELIFLTDFQAAPWMLDDERAWTFLTGLVKTGRMQANIIVAGPEHPSAQNLAIEEIRPLRQIADPFSETSFRVTVANHGGQTAEDVGVTFLADGLIKTSKRISVPPDGRTSVNFVHTFDRPGAHYLACRLRHPLDALPCDNELFLSLEVADRIPILLVDGDPEKGRALGGETGFLRLALAPRDLQDPTWKTVLTPEVIEFTDLPMTSLEKYRGVVLANVPALPGAILSALERFVFSGGGLLVSLGDRVIAENYNRDLFRQGAGLLPVALKERVVESTGFAPLDGSIWALEPFRTGGEQGWITPRFQTYFGTQRPEGKEAMVQVMASFTHGGIALVQKRLGEGKVTLFSSSLDTAWTDLPLHPLFVPFVQNLVYDLVSTVHPPRNLRVGQPITVVQDAQEGSKPYLLHQPQGEPVPLAGQLQGPLAVYLFPATQKPGLYSVEPEGKETTARVFFAVSTEPAESNLEQLSMATWARLEREMGIRRAAGWEELGERTGLKTGDRELSGYLLAAAVCLCFLEVWLARRWG